jgi:hypothetical protein
MINMTPNIAEITGTRLWAAAGLPMHVSAAKKQRPSIVALGGFTVDNSTGVSARERRHR